jgi:drug/metabolite transporter (DMT)-like permease
MLTKSNIHLITIIFISIGLIFIGGALFYQHSAPPVHERNPIFWALAIALASGGGSVLVGIIMKHLMPYEISQQMKTYKDSKI